MKAQGNKQINNYNWITLQVTCCMCDFLADLWMHVRCMWFYGCLLAYAWRYALINSGFSLEFPFPE